MIIWKVELSYKPFGKQRDMLMLSHRQAQENRLCSGVVKLAYRESCRFLINSIYFAIGLTIYVVHIDTLESQVEILYTYLDRPRAYKKDHKGAYDIVPVRLLLA